MSFTRPFLRSEGVGVAVGVGASTGVGETLGATDAAAVEPGEGRGEADGVGETPWAIAEPASNKMIAPKTKRALRARLFSNFVPQLRDRISIFPELFIWIINRAPAPAAQM